VGPYFEFGVGEGVSLMSYARALASLSRLIPVDPGQYVIYAFDTFEGLPASSDLRDVNPDWTIGKFRMAESQVRSRVLRVLPKRLQAGVHFVKGTFEETLTSGLRAELSSSPPAIVNIDCDYYSSCRTVLEWLSPMLRTGAILYFDDAWEFWGHPDYGEPAAIRAFEERNPGRLIPLSNPSEGLIGIGQVYVYVDPHTPLPFVLRTAR
jgi:hypothetical protein